MVIRQIHDCLILKIAKILNVLGAVPLELGIQPEVGCTSLNHALQLCLAFAGEVGIIAVKLQAFLGTCIAWWDISAKLQTPQVTSS